MRIHKLIAVFPMLFATAALAAPAADAPVELHQRIASPGAGQPVAALTLDACGGAYDADLIHLLVAKRVPATIFVTRKWIDRNPAGVADLLAHPDLFELEDHGAEHIPAVIGKGRRVYGIPGEPDIAHLQREVTNGAARINALTGAAAGGVRWYRGATAEYDHAALTEIERMGYRVAGFSVNADAGATLKRSAVAARLRQIKSGDIVIAHMNKPAADTAEGLADALPELLAKGFHFVTLNQIEVRDVDAKLNVATREKSVRAKVRA